MTLNRVINALIVAAALVLTNAGIWLYTHFVTPGRTLSVSSLWDIATVNLAVLLMAASASGSIRRGAERLFFRRRYHIEHALSLLSHTLASVQTVERVASDVRWLLAQTIQPLRVGLFLHEANGRFRRADAQSGQAEVALLPELMGPIEAGELLARPRWEIGGRRLLSPVWDGIPAELLVPLRSDPNTIGILVLSAKGGGRGYRRHDLIFLRTAAAQIALALRHAVVIARLKELNANLERQVEERTAAVNAANTDLNRINLDLNRSLSQLQCAYRQLEQNQASLLQADRLATLGRLSAGIAHEINTPLAAVLNALKVIGDLGCEYASSAGDASVQPEDHREIAAEIIATAQSATDWAQKVAGYIRSVKTARRDAAGGGVAERFSVGAVFEDTCALLAHRLRSASCRIDFEADSPGVSMIGNRAQLGQVLVNVVTNAIDAYEDAGVGDRRIQIVARQAEGTVTITIRDWAGGIPPHVLPHIFDEQFTTKPSGQGSGLGLWIARNIVEQGFGGSLDVLTATGSGSCFYATFPVPAGETDEPPPSAPELALPERATVPDGVGLQLAN